ncbi:site-specific integrase [Devosia sp. 2618]|uniref:tyrosine-type recombinase/integrase n=1 Tax=Devosia sp. 2618 TaxID=3156454 RepID=UPI003398C0F7
MAMQKRLASLKVVNRGEAFQATLQLSGKRYRRQFPTEIEALHWGRQGQLSLAAGDEPDKSAGAASRSGQFRPADLDELVEYLVEHRWRGTKGEKAALINARHIVRIIGPATPLENVTSHVVNLAISRLRDEGYPEVTINKKVSPLRVAIKYAHEQGWIDRIPTMPFFKGGEGRLRYFTAAEEQAMLKWCVQKGHNELWDYIAFSLDTGMRQGEVLTIKNRNLSDGRITVWGAQTSTDNGTKAGNTRTIPLTERALEVCQRRALDNPGFLFPHNKDEIGRMWNKMRTALGFMDDPEFVPHAMRHTFCSRLVMAKVNLAVVQRLAGHLRIETTCRYVHLDDEALVSAIATLQTPAGR